MTARRSTWAHVPEPLQGQGQPRLETVDIFFSMYLERLLEVDDQNYRHKGIYMVGSIWLAPLLNWRPPRCSPTAAAAPSPSPAHPQVYFTWDDSSAYETVRRNTELARNGSRTCGYPCTDWGRDVACCDGAPRAQG